MNEEFNYKNESFIRDLNNKESFMFSWQTGGVLPTFHPKYYDGRINVEIRRIYDESYGNINFEKEEYQISDDLVNNLYNYIENNIEKLIKLALNQTDEMYEGVSHNLGIKYKSIYISLSIFNTKSDEEKQDIIKIEEDLKNIIFQK